MADTPTVVFCFDGLDTTYLDRFQEALPTIAELRETGIETELRSTIPPWTGCAWPTLYTGVGPGTHGAYGFFTYSGYPDTAEIVTRRDVRAPAVWNYLSVEDRRTIVLNMPVTYSAESIEGIVIPGYLSPEDAPGTPPGIRESLSTAIGEPYRIYAENELSLDGQEKLDAYCNLIRLRGRAASHLLASEQWDVAFIQLQKTDAVFHQFDDESAFKRVYQAADQVVADVLQAVPDRPNTILCSDHGMGRATGYSIHINELLRSADLLVPKAENTAPSLREHRSTLLDRDGDNSETPENQLLPMVMRAVRRAGIEPATVYRTLQRVGVADRLVDAIPGEAKRQAVQGVDWERSAAFCRIGSEMGIRLNIEGREPAGVIPSDQYDTVRTDIVRTLEGTTTPDGSPAFAFVEPRERIYDGPALEEAPDVIFLPDKMNHVISPTLVGRAFVPVETFTHQRTGVFVAGGPAFTDAAQHGVEQTGIPVRGDQRMLDLVDVAPIIMASIDAPVPDRLDGTVPDGLLDRDPHYRRYDTVPYGTNLSDQERPGRDVEHHLEDLGYL